MNIPDDVRDAIDNLCDFYDAYNTWTPPLDPADTVRNWLDMQVAQQTGEWVPVESLVEPNLPDGMELQVTDGNALYLAHAYRVLSCHLPDDLRLCRRTGQPAPEAQPAPDKPRTYGETVRWW